MADTKKPNVIEDYSFFGKIESEEFEAVDPMDVYSMYLVAKD